MKELRIVFMGTPDFAVASLKALVEANYNIVGVITAPDKPAGRGRKLNESAVKKYALSHGLEILQPVNLKNPVFLNKLESLQADLQVVVAFRMLPKQVWAMPKMGTFNLHASLLPNYRGAAPINWAIINGEEQTGVTSFKLKHAIDTGDILLQKSCDIDPNDNAGSLHDKLMMLGAETMVETLDGLLAGSLEEKPQKTQEVQKHAPKIFPEDCFIDFNTKLSIIKNFIRGLSPYPVARMKLDGKVLKVFAGHIKYAEPAGKAGELESDGKHYLRINCNDGYLYLDEVQLEGKRKMSIAEFLRGYRVSD